MVDCTCSSRIAHGGGVQSVGFIAKAKLSNELGVGLVGLDAAQFAFGEGVNLCGIDDADGLDAHWHGVADTKELRARRQTGRKAGHHDYAQSLP